MPLIVYVHAHDIFDSGVTFGRHEEADVRGEVRHMSMHPHIEYSALPDRIIELVGMERGSIEVLIFNAHGLPGEVYLRGSGAGVPPLTLSDANAMSPLAPYMRSGGGGLEIHACLVAGHVAARVGRAPSMRATPGDPGPEVIDLAPLDLGPPPPGTIRHARDYYLAAPVEGRDILYRAEMGRHLMQRLANALRCDVRASTALQEGTYPVLGGLLRMGRDPYGWFEGGCELVHPDAE